jgi:hypothetical protein
MLSLLTTVRDFLACDMEEIALGFSYPGEITRKVLITEYSIKLKEAGREAEELVSSAYEACRFLWARSNGNPLAIWDEMLWPLEN